MKEYEKLRKINNILLILNVVIFVLAFFVIKNATARRVGTFVLIGLLVLELIIEIVSWRKKKGLGKKGGK